MWSLFARRNPVENSAYATIEDFRKLFTEDVNSLYLLSFLLTADYKKAEQCFVAGLDDCVNGNTVFREWAHDWARRVIIQNAIRIMSARLAPGKTVSDTFHWANPGNSTRIPLEYAPFLDVLALGDSERPRYSELATEI